MPPELRAQVGPRSLGEGRAGRSTPIAGAFLRGPRLPRHRLPSPPCRASTTRLVASASLSRSTGRGSWSSQNFSANTSGSRGRPRSSSTKPRRRRCSSVSTDPGPQLGDDASASDSGSCDDPGGTQSADLAGLQNGVNVHTGTTSTCQSGSSGCNLFVDSSGSQMCTAAPSPSGIAALGPMCGLGAIVSVPSTGFAACQAVTAGSGYVALLSDGSFARIYVASILENSMGSSDGASIKWQWPLMPAQSNCSPHQTLTFHAPGTVLFVACTSSVQVQAWGAGGGGGSGQTITPPGGGGGGGGGYGEDLLNVTAGDSYTVVVGAGGSGGAAPTPSSPNAAGAAGTAGGSSSFSTAAGNVLVSAGGGQGGASGSMGGAGGAGGTSTATTNTAGKIGASSSALSDSGTDPGLGGMGGDGANGGGGGGGASENCFQPSGVGGIAGAMGSIPGGGGGGAGGCARGYAGASGQVVVTW